jgi:hypothetical protein
MLGTGNPSANPDRFGPATGVLGDNVPYVIDSGVGVVRRWAAATRANKLSIKRALVDITGTHVEDAEAKMRVYLARQ